MHNLRLMTVKAAKDANANEAIKAALAAKGIEMPDYCNFVYDQQSLVAFVWDTRIIAGFWQIDWQIYDQLAQLPACDNDSKEPLIDNDKLLPQSKQMQILTMPVNDIAYSLVPTNGTNRQSQIFKGKQNIGEIDERGQVILKIYKHNPESYSKHIVCTVGGNFADVYDWVITHTEFLDKFETTIAK